MRSNLTATVPAQVEYVQVLRTVIGSASSLLEARLETIQDLRLIVDEACGQLIGLGGNPSSLSMRLEFDTERIDIVITSDAVVDRVVQGPGSVLADRILEALTDEYRLEQAPTPTVFMSKHLGGSEVG